jgi:general secretion pathway protein G
MCRRNQKGFTLVELIVAFTVMMILATMAVPLARARVRVERERELHRALTEMRAAIDKYKDLCDTGVFGPIKQGTYCYPESLDQLVEGVKLAQSANGDKIRFLRRIPRDPFTGKEDWGMRANQDDPKSQSFGGQNLYDVYSKTSERALDGTQLSEW